MTQPAETVPRAAIEKPGTEEHYAHPAIIAGQAVLAEALGGSEPETSEAWGTVVADIDGMIMSAVAARMMATGRLGHLKADQNIPAVNLSEESAVLGRAGEAAKWMTIDESAVSGLMLALMNTARKQHYAARRQIAT